MQLEPTCLIWEWACILLVLVTIFHDEKSFQPPRKNPQIFETEYWMHWHCILQQAGWAKSYELTKECYQAFSKEKLVDDQIFNFWFSMKIDQTQFIWMLDFLSVIWHRQSFCHCISWTANETKSFIGKHIILHQDSSQSCLAISEKPSTGTVQIFFLHSCILGRIEDCCLIIKISQSSKVKTFCIK